MLNSIRLYLIGLILLFMPVIAAGQNSELKEEVDLSIAESVFRFQIKQCAAEMTLRVFLLSLNGGDPSDDFMKRFVDDSVRIRKRSVLAQSKETHEFLDKTSEEFAALLSIDKLKILDEGSAEVDGSCGYADWAARGYRYSLIREGNRWIVKRADSTWFL